MTLRGSLTKPVSLTPAPIPAPPNTDTPNCLVNSQHPYQPIWTLTRFLYQATKRGVDNFPAAGEVNGVLFPYNRTLEIELRNEANGFTQSCAFNDPILDNVTDRWWPCSYAKSPHTFPQRAIETYVQFNRDTGRLKVNQTWYCNDTQQAAPYMITAHGSLPESVSALVCGVSNSTAFQVICQTLIAPIYCDVLFSAQWCSLGGDRDGRGRPLGIRASQTAVQRLPDNALTDPDPVPGQWSCTAASVARGPVVWRLQTRDYLALTAWFGHWKSDQMYTKLRFDLNSSVFWGRPGGGVLRDVGIQQTWGSDASRLTPWLRGFDPTHTFRSRNQFEGRYDAGLGADFYNPLDWSVRFDLSTGYMELNNSWYCDDKNPSMPIVFDGSWNGYIPLNCSYKFGHDRRDFEDGIVCLPVGGDPVVTPAVTHRTVATTIPDPK
ncbi:hypothetical protein MFIFM68171_07269 [Madurella fahalii]|uniref:Uncharacterized protein n=1 Tax=Madurella fahalii TaxID=1157608 RepID=A0ABQ0GH35_9PEZI